MNVVTAHVPVDGVCGTGTGASTPWEQLSNVRFLGKTAHLLSTSLKQKAMVSLHEDGVCVVLTKRLGRAATPEWAGLGDTVPFFTEKCRLVKLYFLDSVNYIHSCILRYNFLVGSCVHFLASLRVQILKSGRLFRLMWHSQSHMVAEEHVPILINLQSLCLHIYVYMHVTLWGLMSHTHKHTCMCKHSRCFHFFILAMKTVNVVLVNSVIFLLKYLVRFNKINLKVQLCINNCI